MKKKRRSSFNETQMPRKKKKIDHVAKNELELYDLIKKLSSFVPVTVKLLISVINSVFFCIFEQASGREKEKCFEKLLISKKNF
jgi:hypothetical protein